MVSQHMYEGELAAMAVAKGLLPAKRGVRVRVQLLGRSGCRPLGTATQYGCGWRYWDRS
jgi:hypothetical protein